VAIAEPKGGSYSTPPKKKKKGKRRKVPHAREIKGPMKKKAEDATRGRHPKGKGKEKKFLWYAPRAGGGGEEKGGRIARKKISV